MASISLSSNLLGTTQSTQSAATTPAANTSGQAKTANATAAPNSQNDTVKLSETAQAKLLHLRGQSVSNIANTLGTTTKAINNDLGIDLQKALEQTLQAAESAAK